MSKEKTLLEAATDMLLNRTESTIKEYANSSIEKTIRKISDIFDLLDEYVMKKNSRLERVLGSNASEYQNEIKQLKDHLIKAEQLFLFDIAQVLDMEDIFEESSDEDEETIEEKDFKSINPSVYRELNKLEKDIDTFGLIHVKSTTDNPKIGSAASHEFKSLKTAFDDFRLAFENAFEDNISESTKEMDDIAAKVAELKVGDKTNFGVVVAKGSNSITFKAKDLPKTKITFNQRKMGSRDYVLSALRKA